MGLKFLLFCVWDDRITAGAALHTHKKSSTFHIYLLQNADSSDASCRFSFVLQKTQHDGIVSVRCWNIINCCLKLEQNKSAMKVHFWDIFCVCVCVLKLYIDRKTHCFRLRIRVAKIPLLILSSRFWRIFKWISLFRDFFHSLIEHNISWCH